MMDFASVYTDKRGVIEDNETAQNNFPAYIDGIDDASFAPYVVTPFRLVLKALNLADISAADGIVDLGCGDGRFCTTALGVYNCGKAWGIDIDCGAIATAETAQRSFPWLQQHAAYEVRDFNNREFLYSRIVHDMQWTVLVLILTPDFQRVHAQFVSDYLNADPQVRRIIAVFFNLENIPSIRCTKRSECGKVFIYHSSKWQPSESSSSSTDRDTKVSISTGESL